jgi:hypothetical protein
MPDSRHILEILEPVKHHLREDTLEELEAFVVEFNIGLHGCSHPSDADNWPISLKSTYLMHQVKCVSLPSKGLHCLHPVNEHRLPEAEQFAHDRWKAFRRDEADSPVTPARVVWLMHRYQEHLMRNAMLAIARHPEFAYQLDKYSVMSDNGWSMEGYLTYMLTHDLEDIAYYIAEMPGNSMLFGYNAGSLPSIHKAWLAGVKQLFDIYTLMYDGPFFDEGRVDEGCPVYRKAWVIDPHKTLIPACAHCDREDCDDDRVGYKESHCILCTLENCSGFKCDKPSPIPEGIATADPAVSDDIPF